jgi:Xaa-Pro aminopeptidase
MTPRERRDTLRGRLEAAGADALLVTKPVNVRYLTGFSGSSGQLIVGEEDVFVTDSRYAEQSARELPDCRREIYETGKLWALVASVVPGPRRLAIEAHDMTVASARRLAEALSGARLVDTEGLVEKLRLVKDEAEIASIRRAAAAGDAAFEEVLGRMREGMTETELAAELEDVMRRAGSEGLSFPTIVAFGESAAEPHHAPAARRLRSGDLVKMDFGATSGGYHSDMTRTVAFGRLSDELGAVYRLVRAAQQAGLDAVLPGATGAAVDAAARAPLIAEGHDFGHGTGHGCGLEVHEAPGLRRESAEVLARGMAVTVEPGIYLPGAGGVRIEDLVAVTEVGCDVLTQSPKDLITV